MPGAMNGATLIQVVPQLKPMRCGVSDHATTLADTLRSSFGIESAFVVLNSKEQCETPYRTIYCRPRELNQACCLLAGKARAALLVHVSGYGYSSDGAPAALADGLANVRDGGRFPVAAYFHELFYTDLTPWKKAFWYSHRQRLAVARIAQTCSLVVTNTSRHALWLQTEKKPGAVLEVLPVFSNVGESAALPRWGERKPALLVFGQASTRTKAYAHLPKLTAFLERLGVKQIIDVGAEADIPKQIGSLEVCRVGRMAPDELGNLISSVKFGFMWYPPAHLVKSGVLASLCAFGAVPVLAKPLAAEIDGLADGIQVITPRTVDSASLEECSRAAWNWYQSHNVNAHARVYSEWIRQKNKREVAAG